MKQRTCRKIDFFIQILKTKLKNSYSDKERKRIEIDLKELYRIRNWVSSLPHNL